jgi:hypothetical protein
MNNAPRIASTSRLSAFFAAAFVTIAMLGTINGLATVDDTNALMATALNSARA